MTTLTTFTIIALIATLGVLGWGIYSMAHGGKYDQEHSSKLMSARGSIQGIAFVLVLIALIITLL